MLPPEIRATTFFAFNPKKLILDPIKCRVDGGFELVESIQYIAAKVLDDEGEDLGRLLTEEEIKSLNNSF